MAKNSKADVAKKAAVIGGVAVGGAAVGGAGMAFGANVLNSDDETPVLDDELIEEDEMEVEEDVEVEYDEPVEVAPTYVAHPVHEEVVDPIVSADDVNDIALDVEPEDAFIASIDPATEEAIEIAEVAEEDFNVDDVVDDILSTDTSEFSYSETTDDHEFGADFDYQSGDLG